jgi:Phytanoyl-CoA dioxygenase (PhyH)
VLTRDQIDYYRTFGFVVVPRLIAADVAALADEFDRVLPEAFGERWPERHDDGISGHYLPAFGPRTPVSRRLAETLLPVGKALLGATVLPWDVQEILLFGEAGLHDDFGIEARGVKLVAYLEPLQARNGALRLVPGSHHPEFRRSLREWLRRNRVGDSEELRRQVESLPCVVAETEPGDVIAFDVHTFHASVYGVDRRQWTVTYLKDPETEEERAAFDEVVADEMRWAEEPVDYDRTLYPGVLDLTELGR